MWQYNPVEPVYLLILLTTSLNAYSQAYILITLIPLITSFITLIRLSVIRAAFNLMTNLRETDFKSTSKVDISVKCTNIIIEISFPNRDHVLWIDTCTCIHTYKQGLFILCTLIISDTSHINIHTCTYWYIQVVYQLFYSQELQHTRHVLLCRWSHHLTPTYWQLELRFNWG